MFCEVQFVQFCADVDNELLASKIGVSFGRFISCAVLLRPHILNTDLMWRQLLVVPPLSDTVVEVAVDEAHCVQVVSGIK